MVVYNCDIDYGSGPARTPERPKALQPGAHASLFSLWLTLSVIGFLLQTSMSGAYCAYSGAYCAGVEAGKNPYRQRSLQRK